MAEAVNGLYEWSKKKIYRSAQATDCFEPIERIMGPLFDFLREKIDESQCAGSLSRLKEHGGQNIWALLVLADFLEDDVGTWQTEPAAQLTLDFIAGMTDSFFKRAVLDIFFPEGVG